MALKIKENVSLPPRILLYGVPGIGKTTFGSKAPNPIFIDLEGGSNEIDGITALDTSKSFTSVLDALRSLAKEDHDYKTVVIDSIDWLEPLIWQQVCEEDGVESIEKVMGGYGKGYTAALDLWAQFLQGLNYLRLNKGMTIILIAHARITRFENPETDAYDRYDVKLNKKASEYVQEWSDAVLFANYMVSVAKEEKAFAKDGRKRAIGSNKAVLYTNERPAAKAKNRYGLPELIDFDQEGTHWQLLKQHIKFYK